MTSQTRQWAYGLLAIAGAVATWYFNLRFMGEHGGFSVALFLSEAYVNAASASLSNDLLVAVAAFLVWLFAECRRLDIPRPWVYVLLTFGIAFAFAFPLFLAVRERRLSELVAVPS